MGVRGRRKAVASMPSSSSSSADWTQGGSERAARCLSLFSALVVVLRCEDASVRGVLDMECEWLFLLGGPSWPSLVVACESFEPPDWALTLDWGRCSDEVRDEAVGGGMGEGSSLLAEDEVSVGDCCSWASGRSRWSEAVPLALALPCPCSLVLRSPMGLLVILVRECEGRPRRTSGTLYQAPGWMSRLEGVSAVRASACLAVKQRQQRREQLRGSKVDDAQ